MRIPKGWTLASVSDHLATVSGEYDAPQDAGTVRVHLLTKTVGRNDPQMFAAITWQDADGVTRFREMSEDDLSERVPPETVRLDEDGEECEVWSFGEPIEGKRDRAA